MAIPIPRPLVEEILLGRLENRRQLQDSPILTDVWIEFAKYPDEALELLVTPTRQDMAGALAFAIDRQLQRIGAEIAPLQGVVAAKLKLEEVIRYVLPLTEWWNSKRVKAQLEKFEGEEAERLNQAIICIVGLADHEERSRQVELLPAIDRLIALAGLILWAREQAPRPNSKDELAEALDHASRLRISELLIEIFETIRAAQEPLRKSMAEKGLAALVSLNRDALPAVARSVPMVKADAARALFHVDCSTIRWAVIDSGIQAKHPAFLKKKDGKRVERGSETSRVVASYDFSNIRRIVSLDNLRILAAAEEGDEAAKRAREERLTLLRHKDLLQKPREKEAIKNLRALAERAKDSRTVDWDRVKPFVEIKIETDVVESDHGTHVAGIIGACKAKPDDDAAASVDDANGMCPDIGLYDFRVLGNSLKETEFAVIAALQFIRHLNSRSDFMPIHGANLSLSIPHDVRNYGCGRTPVCLECERLVDSGVVVVAAAGNYGYHSYTTKDGSFEGYAAFSITDPGNADGVITVGSTHRTFPHTNGVSYFSSRGPTGDGRLKPDLVAPGERIHAPFRQGWDDLDGTSMAAPHVSGAAAMLMARYPELIGQPRRIKQILCASATDLGRERSFQGHGMLDVLRALQSV